MTINERKEKMAELRTKAEALADSINDLMNEGKFTDVVKVTEELVQTVNEHTSISQSVAFDTLLSTENPLFEACKVLTFPTIAAKDEKVDGSIIPVKVIVETDKTIDLLKFYKHANKKVGHNHKWPYMIQKLNCLLTAAIAKELGDKGVNPKTLLDTYQMADIARDIDLGKNPASDANLLETLQVIVNAMVGEGYSVDKADVKFLSRVYAKKGRKALTVAAANHRYLTAYIAEIIHRVITGGSYTVDFKMKK